jgi:hypothetical protein
MLGKIGHRLGRQALAEVVTVARPDTIPAWYRKLVAGKSGALRPMQLSTPNNAVTITALTVLCSQNRNAPSALPVCVL